MKKKTSTIKELQDEGKVKMASELLFKKSNKKLYDRKKLDASIIDEMSLLPKIDWESDFMQKVSEKTDEWTRASILLQQIERKNKWIKEVQDYCSTAGILPSELISFHKEAQKGLKKKKGAISLPATESADLPPQKAKSDRSNWNRDYRNKKLGLNP